MKFDILKMIWPTTRCVVCGKRSETDYPGLCRQCLEKAFAERESVTFCSRCGSFYKNRFRNCPHCYFERPTFTKEGVFTAMPYTDIPAFLVKQLKYHNRRDLAEVMTKLFFRYSEIDSDFDLVTAVPIHKNRMYSRGYNQAEVLGNAIARGMGIPYANTLWRTVDTVSQTKLDLGERRKNPIGAFAPIEGIDVAGKSVLLVDDVLTTGTTARECAKVLKSAGAIRVGIATFAVGISREGRD